MSVYAYRIKSGIIDIEKWKKTGSAKLFGITVNYSFYSDAIKYNQVNIAYAVKCPTLLIHGDTDKIVPLEQSERLLTQLRCDRRLEILKGGHDLSEDNYSRVIDFTKEWFMRWLS
jgi:dipeptidyl aminopeptidase/acylaminoacyl peptidase